MAYSSTLKPFFDFLSMIPSRYFHNILQHAVQPSLPAETACWHLNLISKERPTAPIKYFSTNASLTRFFQSIAAKKVGLKLLLGGVQLSGWTSISDPRHPPLCLSVYPRNQSISHTLRKISIARQLFL